MSLVSQVSTGFTRVATEFKAIRTLIGGSGTATISSLTTTDKTSLVAAINEVKASSSGAPPDASETVKGIVELATTSEVTTGTDTTRAVTPAGVAAAVAALVASAPGTLNTLDELAAALGDDPSFATSIATSLSGKQPLDTDLTAIAALTSAANKVPYATGAGTWALADLTSFGRSLIDDADAAAGRATLAVYSTTEIGDPATDFSAVFVAALA